MERKLASIQKIIDLQPIPNADAIEVATVLGWKVVVKKGEFKVGDYCIYCEIDSILPEVADTMFLAPKFRVKTVRLRGQISQGICFPTSFFTAVTGFNFIVSEGAEGQDVTEFLSIKKYEPPMPVELAGLVRGPFPGFIPKTDETRIQTYPHILQKYKDVEFCVTEKVDGTSTTFFYQDDEFHACSRNMDLKEEGNNTIWQIAKELKLPEVMAINKQVVLQGELVGPKIQDNPLKLGKRKILFFNAYDMSDGTYLPFHLFRELINQYGLETVPVLEESTMLPETVDMAVAYATRNSKLVDALAEGVVFRPVLELRDEDLGRLSFKVINPEYLLKHGQ